MAVTIKDYDLRDCYEVERNLLSWTGFYPTRNARCTLLNFLKSTIVVVVCVIQFFSMLIEIIKNRTDLSKLSEALLYFITLTCFLVKLFLFVSTRNNLLHVEDTLAKPTFYGLSQAQTRTIDDQIVFCKRSAVVFRFFCVLAVTLYGLIPLFDNSDPKKLPLPGWFPYNITRFYFLSAASQVAGSGFTAYNNSSIDILTWMLITIASAQFGVLKDNLTQLDYSADNSDEILKKCVERYSETVGLVSQIEKAFSKGIFIQLFASVIVICCTGFFMMIVPMKSVQFIFLIMYFGGMMCQITMYCWYGHDIMTTSSEIGEAFGMSNWYKSDRRIRQKLMILLERAKRPITVSAGGFVVLSLTTFTSIMRSSYSYFAVLQHLYTSD